MAGLLAGRLWVGVNLAGLSYGNWMWYEINISSLMVV